MDNLEIDSRRYDIARFKERVESAIGILRHYDLFDIPEEWHEEISKVHQILSRLRRARPGFNVMVEGNGES